MNTMMKANKNLRKIIKSANVLRKLLVLATTLATPIWGQAQLWSLQQYIDTEQVHNKNLQMGRNNMLLGEEKLHEVKAN